MIRKHSCPICEKDFDARAADPDSYYPFCSDRCKKVDFFRWWDGRYTVVQDITDESMIENLLEENPEAFGDSEFEG